MSFNDTVSDMLARIKNAQKANYIYVNVLSSKVSKGVLSVLKQEGFIEDFVEESITNVKKIIKVKLKYYKSKPVIKKFNRVSKPGLRVFSSVNQLSEKKFYSGLGLFVISTSKGILSDRDAIKMNVGGEVLCNVY